MRLDTGEVSYLVCRYPVEDLQVEGVSSLQHALVLQHLQRHVGHVRVAHGDAVLPQTPVWGVDTERRRRRSERAAKHTNRGKQVLRYLERIRNAELGGNAPQFSSKTDKKMIVSSGNYIRSRVPQRAINKRRCSDWEKRAKEMKICAVPVIKGLKSLAHQGRAGPDWPAASPAEPPA